MAFYRSRCLAAFERYNETTGGALVSLEELGKKTDADLALFASGIVVALLEAGRTTNGSPAGPLAPPLSELLAELIAVVGIPPQAHS